MSTDNTKRKLKNLRPFKAGAEWKGNAAGRPKGSRNKLSELFFEELCADWQKGGAEAIEKTRQEQPDIYFRIVASLMPKELKIEDGLSNMTTEQITQRIREIDAAIAAELAGRPATTTPETDAETEPSTKH